MKDGLRSSTGKYPEADLWGPEEEESRWTKTHLRAAVFTCLHPITTISSRHVLATHSER